MKNIQSIHIKAVAVEGVVETKALTECNGLAGSDLQDGGVPSEYQEVVCNAYIPLDLWRCM